MATPSDPGKGAAEPERRHHGSRGPVAASTYLVFLCSKHDWDAIARIPLGAIVIVIRAIVVVTRLGCISLFQAVFFDLF